MQALHLQHLLIKPDHILLLRLELNLDPLDHLFKHFYLDILIVDLVL